MKKKLTKAQSQLKKYKETGSCPFCGSDNALSGSGFDSDGGPGVWQELFCASCSKSWQDNYELVSITEIKE